MKDIKDLYLAFLKAKRVCIDTRKVEKGDLFFALKGPNFDGNLFAKEAIKKGAIAAVVDDPTLKGAKFILVENSLESLQELALHHRKQFKKPILAITGSNGKTTTKELVSAVLSTSFKVHHTKGNLNNHIGVPLSLLEITNEHDFAIIEMGANNHNEINQLCSFALPTGGLITNIGKAHLEGFGSIEGVTKAKGELFDFLEASGGKVFLNMNDYRIAKLGYFIQSAITYGSGRWNNVDVKDLKSGPYLAVAWTPKGKGKLVLDEIVIKTQLIGSYNLDNVIAAIAVGVKAGVKPEHIKKAIEDYCPKNNRSEIIKHGSNTIILDAYNANPSSMMAALTSLSSIESSKKVVILGDMLELGNHSEKEHKAILDHLKTMDLDEMVVVGNEFGAALNGSNPDIKHFDSIKELKTWHKKTKFKDAHILIKGSRAIALEKLLMD